MGLKSSKKLQGFASDGETQELRVEVLDKTSTDIGSVKGALYRSK